MSALTQVKERYSMQVRNGISPTNPTKLSITENGEFKNSSCWRTGLTNRQTVGGDRRKRPHSPVPSPLPSPTRFTECLCFRTAGWRASLDRRKEPCLSGHKAKTSKVDASPTPTPCLYVHRELSSGPCTENTTVIYPKEVNNVDYLFNYCYFYYCCPLVESTAVVRGGNVGTMYVNERWAQPLSR